MRLGVLLDRMEPAAGGAEAQTAALLRRALEAEGDDPPVLAVLEGEAPAGVRTIRVRAPRRRPARDRVLATEGERLLREAGCDRVLAVRHALRCDVYLPRGGLVGDALAANDRARGGASPLRRWARALSGKHRFFAEAEAALLDGREGPRVIALSRALAERVRTLYPASARRVTVIPNGVDAARFYRVPFEAGRPAARRALVGTDDAYVGLLVAHNPRLKGLETALRALARPEVAGLAPSFRLVVAGKGVDRAMRRLASSLGVAGAVTFHGPVEDARPLLAAADVLVHPTWYDPCSTACLEALAMGLPVITTPVNGVAELMGQRGGIVVEEPGNPEAIAVAIRVLADPALRAMTADDARYLAERNRQATRLDQVLDVCRAAADRRRASGSGDLP
jgi:UDP-glucose:(heptosyl)LPS alpha-1,3-glucosyltransferase